MYCSVDQTEQTQAQYQMNENSNESLWFSLLYRVETFGGGVIKPRLWDIPSTTRRKKNGRHKLNEIKSNNNKNTMHNTYEYNDDDECAEYWNEK
jgi:hypothetical protein